MIQHKQSNPNMIIEDACADAIERVLAAFPDILDKMVEKAKEGSLQHAKFLFDWAKLEPSFPDEQTADCSGPSLAKMLLDRLQEDTAKSDPAHATKVL
ncbi:MAG TPA: hypothetical protein VKW78_18215 [Terriglobales bacterium]|nr:hypothetical protein [Terriglobales bacterium]